MRRSTRHGVTAETTAHPQTRGCDHPNCAGLGEYRAPRSRDRLDSYYWFCLEHVRAYNAAWDYYAGMSADQIERALREDVVWQRPTWPIGARPAGRFRIDPDRLRDPFGFFAEQAGEGAANGKTPRKPTPEEEAMIVLDLKLPVTVVEIKARYKELVKRFHPDANGGSKAAEERFKLINQAYKTLMNSLNA